MVNTSDTHGLLWRDLGDERCALGMLLVCIMDLEDQRRAGGMLLGFLEVLGGPLEVPWGPSGVSWEVLGRPWRPWERPGIVLGGPWGDFGGLGRSLSESWEVRMLIFLWF